MHANPSKHLGLGLDEVCWLANFFDTLNLLWSNQRLIVSFMVVYVNRQPSTVDSVILAFIQAVGNDRSSEEWIF